MKFLRKKQIFMLLTVVITTILTLNVLPILGSPNDWPIPDPDPDFILNVISSLF